MYPFLRPFPGIVSRPVACFWTAPWTCTFSDKRIGWWQPDGWATGLLSRSGVCLEGGLAER
jgi:hypothetical protein